VLSVVVQTPSPKQYRELKVALAGKAARMDSRIPASTPREDVAVFMFGLVGVGGLCLTVRTGLIIAIFKYSQPFVIHTSLLRISPPRLRRT
jgi:hypothetical protein